MWAKVSYINMMTATKSGDEMTKVTGPLREAELNV
jgi:hypothetical protein